MYPSWEVMVSIFEVVLSGFFKVLTFFSVCHQAKVFRFYLYYIVKVLHNV